MHKDVLPHSILSAWYFSGVCIAIPMFCALHGFITFFITMFVIMMRFVLVHKASGFLRARRKAGDYKTKVILIRLACEATYIEGLEFAKKLCRQGSLSQGTSMLLSTSGRSSTPGQVSTQRSRPRWWRSLTFRPKRGSSHKSCAAPSLILCAPWPSPVTARMLTFLEAQVVRTPTTRSPTSSTNSTCLHLSAKSWFLETPPKLLWNKVVVVWCSSRIS